MEHQVRKAYFRKLDDGNLQLVDLETDFPIYLTKLKNGKELRDLSAYCLVEEKYLTKRQEAEHLIDSTKIIRVEGDFQMVGETWNVERPIVYTTTPHGQQFVWNFKVADQEEPIIDPTTVVKTRNVFFKRIGDHYVMYDQESGKQIIDGSGSASYPSVLDHHHTAHRISGRFIELPNCIIVDNLSLEFLDENSETNR